MHKEQNLDFLGGPEKSAVKVFVGSNFNGLTPDCNLITGRCEGIQPTVADHQAALFVSPKTEFHDLRFQMFTS